MKKRLIVIVLVMGITGCGKADSAVSTASLEKQVEKLQSENEKLQSDNEKLKSENEKLKGENSETEKLDETKDNTETLSNDKFKDVIVKITNKVNYEVDYNAGRYSPFVEFPYSVTNNTDKEIKGIQGVLHIKDMFGEKIMDIQCDLTSKNIPAGQTIEEGGSGLEINEFMQEHKQLYSTSYENLVFEYEFTNILFADGSAIN